MTCISECLSVELLANNQRHLFLIGQSSILILIGVKLAQADIVIENQSHSRELEE